MFALERNWSDFNEKNAATTTAENRSKSLLDYNSQRDLIRGEYTLKLPKVQEKESRYRKRQIVVHNNKTSHPTIAPGYPINLSESLKYEMSEF